MKLKSLLYGTAAVLVGTGASTGAMAADLPVAAEPVEYVRVCDAFGKGFYYIPGTDTCLRVNGRVRVRAFIRDEHDSDKNYDHYKSYARAYINLDARNETDLGLLRSYISMYWTYGSASGQVSTSNYDLGYDHATTVDEAFITLSNDMGQLTVGKTASFFDFFGGYTYTGNGGFDQTTDAVEFAYTFNAGNGVSASLSLEDAYASGRKATGGRARDHFNIGGNDVFSNVGIGIPSILDPDIGPGPTAYADGVIYGGQEIPDIVANLRVDQGWGSAQIMGALRRITTKERNCIVTSITAFEDFCGGPGPGGTTDGTPVSYVDDEWGWAIGAGLEINVPGMPVSLAMQGGYSEGAVSYVAAAPAYLTDAFAVGPVALPASGSLELTEGWQIGGGVSIAATPTVTWNIDGAYGDIDHYGSLHDYDYWGVATNIDWTPVSGLAVGAEIQYSEVNADLNSVGDSQISDTDSWQFTINFQRDF